MWSAGCSPAFPRVCASSGSLTLNLTFAVDHERCQPEAVIVGDVGEAEARLATRQVVVGGVGPGDFGPELDRAAVRHLELERQSLPGFQAIGREDAHPTGADVEHLLEAGLRRRPVGNRRRLDASMLPAIERHARSLCPNSQQLS